MTFTKEQKTHHLKIYPEHFSAVLTGVKRAELRKNDRDFKVGDTLHLMETPKGSCLPTGEFVNAVVTHIADAGDWLPGYVLLSIEREPAYTAPPAPVVPEEMPKGLAGQIVSLLAHNIGDKLLARKIWYACRAAMLRTRGESAQLLDLEAKDSASGPGQSEPVSQPYKLPPHVYRELVNSLRDTAVKYHGCQQLREQISETLSAVITHTSHCAIPEQGVKP